NGNLTKKNSDPKINGKINYYGKGLVHLNLDLWARRIQLGATKFVAQTGVQMLSLMWTYIHESAHAWGDADDGKYVPLHPNKPYGFQHGADWCALADHVTSADFLTYLLLRLSCKIRAEPGKRVTCDPSIFKVSKTRLEQIYCRHGGGRDGVDAL